MNTQHTPSSLPSDPSQAESNGKQRAFHLRVSEDGLSVLLDCAAPEGDCGLLVDRVQRELSKLGVAQPPTREHLETTLRSAALNGADASNLVLVKGEEPVAPRDGVVEWERDFFDADFAVDQKTGAVDYRRKIDHCTVVEGQLLGRLIEPLPGREGRDVFGKPVPVADPRREQLLAGANVRAEQDGEETRFTATGGGRIRLDKNRLMVDAVYHVSGDVGLATGHIEHPGAVEIMGDVCQGTKVVVGGDLDVHGTIESADVESGGNLTVRRGVNGNEKCFIRVAGSVHAQFIQNAKLEAGEDIIVENEIVNSTLKTRGRVRMPGGRVVGGSVEALGEIVIGQGGSAGQVRTALMAGNDYRLEEELAEKRERIAQDQKELTETRQAAGPLLENQKNLTHEQREQVTEALMMIADLEGEIESMNQQMEQQKKASSKRANPRVRVQGKIYPETMLWLRRRKKLVAEDIDGPVRAIIAHDRIEFRTDTP